MSTYDPRHRQTNAVHAAWRYEPPTDREVDTALARLAALPLDVVPDPAGLPPGSWMPLTRNPRFVGRQESLRELAAVFKGGGAVATGQVVTITGRGGIGKSQLASEFVHRYGQYFVGVYWLSFGDLESLPAEIAQVGLWGTLDLPPSVAELSLAEQVRLVRQQWRDPLPRLFVFDNCEAPLLLRQWRPPLGPHARVLLTSRSVGTAGQEAAALHLDVLARPESIALLRTFCPHAGEGVLDEIAAEVDDLPLALNLAGSVLQAGRDSPQRDPATYLERLREARGGHPSMTGRDAAGTPADHRLSTEVTFQLSYEQLDARNTIDGLARRVLARAAHFLPGEPIPRALLLATLPGEGDELDGSDALQRLLELGLLEREAGASLRLHQLLADAARQQADDPGAQAAVEVTAQREAYRLHMAGYPAPLLVWQAHLRHITERAHPRGDERGAALASTLAYHLESIGKYAEAQPLYERALAIREAVLGPQHPDTAQSLNDLAGLYRAQGAYPMAQPLYERALAIHEAVLGPEHPDTAQSLNNLAYVHLAQGAYGGARPLFERALAINEAVLGREHPHTAQSLNNLAYLYQSLGAHESAQPLFERALAIYETVLGPNHPTTALGLNNLAGLYQRQGAHEAARPLYERALAIREAVLGPEHPDTALSLSNLALLYQAQGAHEAALPLYERALEITEAMLGAEHPYSRIVRGNLQALQRRMQGKQAPRTTNDA